MDIHKIQPLFPDQEQETSLTHEVDSAIQTESDNNSSDDERFSKRGSFHNRRSNHNTLSGLPMAQPYADFQNSQEQSFGPRESKGDGRSVCLVSLDQIPSDDVTYSSKRHMGYVQPVSPRPLNQPQFTGAQIDNQLATEQIGRPLYNHTSFSSSSQPMANHGRPVQNPVTADIEGLIKNLVYKEFQNSKPVVKKFDVAVLYHRKDYEEVQIFKNELRHIVKTNLGDDLLIELYDNEESFSQSKVKVVKELSKKCSLVLCYLTKHFNSRELEFITEEAIATSNFHGSSDKNLAIKVVHTLPKELRNYELPSGFMSTHSIDWFDRYSSFTNDKIIKVCKEAIKKRKQNLQNEKTLSDFRHAYRFQPRSKDLRQESSNPPRTGIHNESVRAQHCYPRTSIAPEMNVQAVRPSHVQHKSQQASAMTQNSVPTAFQYPPHTVVAQNTQTFPNFDKISSPSMIVNNNQRSVIYSPREYLNPVQQTESPYSQQHSDIHRNTAFKPLQQSTVNQHQMCRQLSETNRLNQDGPESISFTSAASREDNKERTYNSNLRVVSKNTGRLIVNPNLSTDDVEIDTHEDQSFRHTTVKQVQPQKLHRNRRLNHRLSSSEGSSGEDEVSDNEDNPLASILKGQADGTIINIIGSKIVQIGNANAVKHKKDSKEEDYDDRRGRIKRSSNSSPEKSDSSEDKPSRKLSSNTSSRHNRESCNSESREQYHTARTTSRKTSTHIETNMSVPFRGYGNNGITQKERRYDNDLDATSSIESSDNEQTCEIPLQMAHAIDTTGSQPESSYTNLLSSSEKPLPESQSDRRSPDINAPFIFSNFAGPDALRNVFRSSQVSQNSDRRISDGEQHSSGPD